MIDPVALRAELTNDPKGMAYAIPKSKAQDQLIADMMNLRGGVGAGPITIASMAKGDFLLAISPIALVLASRDPAMQAKWDRILTLVAGAPDPIKVGSPAVLGLLTVAVNDGLLTANALTGLTTRTGSRAEVLFGDGTVVTAIDIGAAR